ncbi:cupin domain-containing protein [Actinomycetospora straminea]|uniref:Cupin type-2 domain-containing protein n=1 Tax=Actinomycetospora straminea TaxID=663607 RepID=A0ABP9EK80_9PSEU|nr:cupin domain-containing protein [Actinomycetospora straminea]MDD7936706.1 cupin domain-containing protein [Actinomycetospora straminea]
MTTLTFPDGQVIAVETSAPDFVFSAVLPPRHTGPPAHRHRHEREVFTVESGQLVVRLGRERRLLQPGETVVVPPGTTHAFANPFGEPVRLRTVESPAGPLQAQLRALAASAGRPPLRELARINAEHDWSFTVAGLPDPPQRALWWLLAHLGRRAGDCR